MAKESRIEILRGNEAGAQFRITGSKVRIGRATDSDIVVTDSSASRNHAELIRMNESFVIKDLNSSNGIVVNGKKVKEHYLNSGDVFSVGNHEYRYLETDNLPHRQSSPLRNPDGTIAGLSSTAEDVDVPISAGGPKNKKMVMYLVVLVVLVLVILMLPSKKEQKQTVASNGQGLNSVAAQQTTSGGDIFPTDTEEDKFKRKIPDDERELFDTANEHYFEGQRELRLQNYSRALEEFKKAMTFYPQHTRARTAAGQTAMKIDEESQRSLAIGKKMVAQGRYEDALRHFNEVLNLNVRQPETPLYKEAEKWKNMAEKRKGEIFEQ